MIINADILEWCKTYSGEPFMAVLTDPPYGLNEEEIDIQAVLIDWMAGREHRPRGAGFMGRDWDSFIPGPAIWRAIRQHCYPGAFLFAFGGTRTADLLALALRLAGWEKRDEIDWVYASGFPKNHHIGRAIDRAAKAQRPIVGTRRHQPKFDAAGFDYRKKDNGFNSKDRDTFNVTAPASDLSRAWDGHGTALKPAHEPILVFRNPLTGTYAENCVRTGAGALWIDGGRIDASEGRPHITPNHRPGFADVGVSGGSRSTGETTLGRWPSNLLLQHSEACDGACAPDCPVQRLGESAVDVPVFLRYNKEKQGVNQCCELASTAVVNSMLVQWTWREDSADSVAKNAAMQVAESQDVKTHGVLFDRKAIVGDGIATGANPEAEKSTGSLNTDGRGNKLMDQSHQDMTFTTLTTTQKTTICPTCNSYLRMIIMISTNESERITALNLTVQRLVGANDVESTSHLIATLAEPLAPTADIARVVSWNISANGGRKTRTTNANISGSGDENDNDPSRYFFQVDYMYERLEAADPLFYCPKADRAEREAGLDPRQIALLGQEDIAESADTESGALRDGGRSGRIVYGQFAQDSINDGRQKPIDNPYQRGETTRRNIHPTLKPLSLTRYLATLLLPPTMYAPRRLLVPFAGAASEYCGAILAGWEEIVGVEIGEDYCRIAEARAAYWTQRRHEFLDPSKPIAVKLDAAPDEQLDMFMDQPAYVPLDEWLAKTAAYGGTVEEWYRIYGEEAP